MSISLKRNESGMVPIIEVILVVIVVAVIGLAIFMARSNGSKVVTVVSPSPSASPSDVYAGWATYSSKTELAKFRYPTTWTKGESSISPNVKEADSVGFTSPSKLITISWVSVIDGLGGGCDANAALGSTVGPNDSPPCPLITVIAKTPVPGASGLYVISGTKTTDNSIFEPWLAVQDANGLVATTRNMDYDTFLGRNNGKTLNQSENIGAGFASSLATTSGPKLSKSDATAYFDKPEVKTAKLILLSLKYN